MEYMEHDEKTYQNKICTFKAATPTAGLSTIDNGDSLVIGSKDYRAMTTSNVSNHV